MDLSALSKISSKKTQNMQDERQKRFDRLYRMGAEYLKRAKKTDFSDRSLVKKAGICFSQAIENNRRDPRPLVKLGYISTVFRDTKLATRYLNEALRLDPENKDAKKLLAHIEKQSTQAIKNLKKDKGLSLQKVQKLSEAAPVTGKAFYLQTQELILTQIRESFERMQGIQPTLVPINLQKFEEIHQQLETNYEELNQKLDQLEEEGFDIEPLERDFQKLEVNLNLMEDTCKLSRKMIALKKSIQEETSKVQDWNQVLEMHPAPEKKAEIDSHFDEMMDRSDELADELDELEGSGFDIQALMKYYNQFSAACHRLEKLLED
ncbi:hypothetical protein COW36_12145 [bacterium (Candidatus Blackallbacteria) CG17_big_fil_post_rev_8_21_14_2_50_48_46]|uniref:Uncharacterized protein n=1 Tax=bacterium (Candidatus Blackallbacteria) CG17_big_fil_post_rev_8_21_14_2_50_48_46 TaxID=2014261 RepID=A0A2M7G3Q5_9BACT|nr:MAG: hypothetical protein COW64_03115 [bacterium (Candidatus Blackallbacteria) CG18_big_fil_WC_8_21_14_2_50_49_26]PIW16510.1 MAG: hypothetical protein COW36_12145 [bacterium (Candidatus Blackallbacteria) CG17_big_fil_post_rev_8_21_14_2_50_48_46]PIW46018.1 MAG: hypothetical protein COW20_17410 [bacterium (Candidatus Blackallbacteria) CG13_big_fil_rev_8_21_14_2_50_49_14]